MSRIEVEQEQSSGTCVPCDPRGLVPGTVAPSAMSGIFFVVILCVVNQYIGAGCVIAQNPVELCISMFQIRGIDNALAAGLNAISVSSLGMIQRKGFHRNIAYLYAFGFHLRKADLGPG